MGVYSYTKKQKNPITILARNEAFDFTCRECKKPAEYLHIEARYDVENPFYCNDCLEFEQKDYDPDMALPVCNSPRMGVCGYQGNNDTQYSKFKEVKLA